MKKSLLMFAFIALFLVLPHTVFAHPVQFHENEGDFAAEQLGETTPYIPERDTTPIAGVNLPGLFDQIATLLGRLFPAIRPVATNTPTPEAQVEYRSLGAFFVGLVRSFTGSRDPSDAAGSSASQYPEIGEIIKLSDTDEQGKIYRKLIERVGPVEAQEALFRSGLPFTGETHLIQHTVGVYLYETEGQEGISKCTLYFLAACYHEFIISLLAAEGLEALPEVMKECWKFGPAIATQCAHGIGHGLLVWQDYQHLDEAAAGCEKLQKESPDFPALNCYEGVFMENFWALHPGATSESQWLSDTDPYYPCSDPRIKYEWQAGCWLNQGSVMYTRNFKGDIGKTSAACLKVEDTYHRQLCFNSLSRQVHPITKGDYATTVRMCGEFDPAWNSYCLETISVADFSVGGRDLSYKICENIAEDKKQDCYNKLAGIIRAYATNAQELASFCAPISSEKYRSQCLASKQF